MPHEPADARRRALLEASVALQVGVDDAAAERLLGYLDRLERWNKVYNLTAVREPASMLVQHVFDCLAGIAPLRRQLGESGRLLDVGSGAGLPGVVVAVLCPGLSVVCVDSVGKKAAFIRQVALELRLSNLSAAHSRVEAFEAPPFDVVASRAFASLDELVRMTRRHLSPGGVWMAMKGRRPDAEIAALPTDIDVFHVEPLAVPGLAADRCIVWMRAVDGK